MKSKKDNFDNFVTIGAIGLGAYLLFFSGKKEGSGSEGGSFVVPTIPGEYVQPISTPSGTSGTKKEVAVFNLTPISGSLLDTLGSGQGAVKYIPSAGFVTPFAPLTPYQQLLGVSQAGGTAASKKEASTLIGANRADPNSPANQGSQYMSPSGQVYTALQRKMGVVLK